MQTQSARPLVRRRAERKIAGVAAGLADYVGIDPIWVRLLFVLTTFAGGLGLVAYVALWVLMPVSDEPSTGARRSARELTSRFGSSTAGTIIIAIGVLIVATQVFDRRPGLFWGLALIALGAYLFRERSQDPEPRAAISPAPRAAAATSAPVAPEESAAPPALRAPRRPRDRSPLGALTFGAMLIVVGLMWLVNMTTDVDIRLVQYLAASLTVLGMGIGIGAWVGRARWLVLPALILLPMTVLASAITIPFDGGFSGRWLQPTRYSSLASEYRAAAGVFTFNLAGLPAPRAASDVKMINVSVVIGHIDVYVPPDIAVDVRSHLGVGKIDYDGRDFGFFDVDASRRFGPAGVPAVLTFDLHASIGGISVYRVEREPESDEKR